MKTFLDYLKRKKRILIVFSFVLVSFSQFSFVDNYFEISKNLDIFATVLRELNNYYVDDIKPGELMKKGIDSMLESLDPYTEYYPESDIEDYKTMITGQYGGIGALIRQKGDYCVVAEPYENFPAQKVGLQAGDVILEINGQSAKGKTTNDVSKLLKGQANTSVKLLVQREGEAKSIEKTLLREEIKIKNVPYYGVVNDSIGYIKLTSFTENAAKEVKDALLDLKAKNRIKGVMLDLRGNGGGLLREAVDIVNLFIDKNQVIVSQKAKIKDMNRIHKSENTPVDTQIPLAVLVDHGSASASEIVSGAIQDLDRGVIVGQKTFGKGLVQQTVPLSYNTQMKVTIAKYYTPSGRCIQALDYSHRNADGSVDKVPDSLITEFKTKNSRSVYDGSGIFPDIPTEPKKLSNISATLLNKMLIFDYATQYRLKHPSLTDPKKFNLSGDEYKEFVGFLANKDYDYTTKSEKSLEEFKKNADGEKYFDDIRPEYEALKNKIGHNKKDDLNKFRDEIKQLIEEEIVSRYYYQRGRLEASLKNDETLVEGINSVTNKTKYVSILKGTGSYKVIGKPKDAQATANNDEPVKDKDKKEGTDNVKKNKKGG